MFAVHALKGMGFTENSTSLRDVNNITIYWCFFSEWAPFSQPDDFVSTIDNRNSHKGIRYVHIFVGSHNSLLIHFIFLFQSMIWSFIWLVIFIVLNIEQHDIQCHSLIRNRIVEAPNWRHTNTLCLYFCINIIIFFMENYMAITQRSNPIIICNWSVCFSFAPCTGSLPDSAYTKTISALIIIVFSIFVLYLQFNLTINDEPGILAETKKVIDTKPGETIVSRLPLCVEISLRTVDGDKMILEVWSLSCNKQQTDNSSKVSHSIYSRIGILLKSLILVTRSTPAYKLSRKQSTESYNIFYHIYTGNPSIHNLGELKNNNNK